MRLQTYLLVYFQQLSSNALRTSFIFVQAQIITFYNTNTIVLGFLYALFSLLMGLVFVYRTIYPYHKPVHTNFINNMIISIMMLLVAVSMVLGIKSLAFYFIAYILYALLQGALQNILVALLTRKFNTSEDGFLMGLWASSPHIGSIFSFLLFTVLIYYIKLDWKWCLVVSPVLCFIAAGLLRVLQKELQTEEQLGNNLINVKAFFSKADKITLLIANLGLAATLYGIMQWLPMYLNQEGFEEFEGYITISLIGFTIVGTMVCKQIYSLNLSRKTQLLVHLILITVGILSLLIIFISNLTPHQKWIFLLLIGIVGFTLGSLFNFYLNHEIILLTEKYQEDVCMNMNICYGFAYLFTVLTQIIIGLCSSVSANSIFLVFMVLSFISMGSIVFRVCLEWRSQTQSLEFEEDSE